jgi:phosphate transport system permease protein
VIVAKALYMRRRAANGLFLLLSVAAALFGLVWLAFILYALLKDGLAALSPTLFTESTPPPGSPGGLLNAILGSLMMSLIAVAVGTPIGLFAGTYLAEYGRHGRLAFVLRFVNDILLSAPSIVTGIFVYEIVVAPMHHFSGWAGALALMIIVIPVVVRTTENMLLLVPNGLREAASALGAPNSFVIRSVTWRAARAGIITGVLLSIARISGETAPLLFTALSNFNFTADLNQPIYSLPVVIFNYALSPYEDWHRLAWAGALLVTATVLMLSIMARLLEKKRDET